MASLNIFSAPNDLFSKGVNFALGNSVFALGGSIIISEWRQKHREQQIPQISQKIERQSGITQIAK